jgi:hypothetical protein
LRPLWLGGRSDRPAPAGEKARLRRRQLRAALPHQLPQAGYDRPSATTGRGFAMSAPNACPECGGSGWVMYAAETIEGEEEWAWKLCPACEGGDAFPPKEGGAGRRERRAALRARRRLLPCSLRPTRPPERWPHPALLVLREERDVVESGRLPISRPIRIACAPTSVGWTAGEGPLWGPWGAQKAVEKPRL